VKNKIIKFELLFSAGLLFSSPVFAYNYISWSASSTEYMLEVVGNLWSDLTPLLVPIIAIGVALIVIESIIWAVKKH
jgi:hypothetical protein